MAATARSKAAKRCSVGSKFTGAGKAGMAGMRMAFTVSSSVSSCARKPLKSTSFGAGNRMPETAASTGVRSVGTVTGMRMPRTAISSSSMRLCKGCRSTSFGVGMRMPRTVASSSWSRACKGCKSTSVGVGNRIALMAVSTGLRSMGTGLGMSMARTVASNSLRRKCKGAKSTSGRCASDFSKPVRQARPSESMRMYSVVTSW